MRESTVGAGVEMGVSVVREGREIGSDPTLVLSEAGKLSLMVVNHLHVAAAEAVAEKAAERMLQGVVAGERAAESAAERQLLQQ